MAEQRWESPRHEHDCDICIYLGPHGKYDLYVCPSERTIVGPGQPTVIARYGPQGDYLSGLSFVGFDDALTEAARRAIRVLAWKVQA